MAKKKDVCGLCKYYMCEEVYVGEEEVYCMLDEEEVYYFDKPCENYVKRKNISVFGGD